MGGYVLPKSQMTNADLARIINSDEIQSKLNPAKESGMTKMVKKNPLKNVEEMEKLNPFVKIMRQQEQAAQEDRKAKRAKTVAAKRNDGDRKAASLAFYENQGGRRILL